MGRLERHLDTELTARVRAGVRHPPTPATRQRQPRSALTYRSARRAQARELGVRWPGLPATTHALPYGVFKVVEGQAVPRNKQYKPNGKRECLRRRWQQIFDRVLEGARLRPPNLGVRKDA